MWSRKVSEKTDMSSEEGMEDFRFRTILELAKCPQLVGSGVIPCD